MVPREAVSRWAVVLTVFVLVGGGTAAVLPGFAGGVQTAAAEPAYDATVRWTSYGIPHITADDWGSLGYGYGYAAATDYLCLLAEEYVTVNGERSRFFGPDGTYRLTSNGQAYTNVESDLFFTLLKENPDLVDSVVDYPRAEIQDALDGFVHGYNRYLADTPQEDLPAECAEEPWVRPITPDDVRHRANKLLLIASMGYFAPYMVAAEPPAPDAPAAPATADADADAAAAALAEHLPTSETLGLGSNGYAFGSDVTANGRGMLLGNPHFPWQGPERFHQLHLTIPGEVDVMGMTLLGMPVVLIGFNDAVAWTHTVSTGWRFSVHELTLVPGDPTAYVVDGEVKRMTSRTVTVDTGAGEATHTFWFSEHGPIIHFDLAGLGVADAGLTWTPAHAYALNDVNARNNRTVEHFFRWNTATDFDTAVADMREVHGLPWVNTIAASPDGRAFYADATVVPNYDAEKIARCNTPIGRALFAAARLPVFDASRSVCAPTVDARAAQPGIIPAEEMPLIETRDWLINSNDAYWLPNPDYPLEGYSPMIGPERYEQSGRTRMGFVLAQERVAGTFACDVDPDVPCGKMTLARLQESLFSNRLFYPERELDNILAGACAAPVATSTSGRPVDVTAACDALAAWDRRATTESAGLPLFELFWQRAPKAWTVPFDHTDPVNTPRGFVAHDPRVPAALADAVLLLEGAGIPVDATAGEARFTERGGERFPLHGASHATGSPSMLVVPFEPGEGFLEPVHGNSYIQTVTWDEDGTPVAEAVLSYSQSPHADSPHHADQTRLYSEKRWVPLPFTEDAITQDPELRVLRLTT